jgi:clan AA aspartic protease (TIGR02281 family)
MRRLLTALCDLSLALRAGLIALAGACAPAAVALDFSHEVPLARNGSGGFSVTAEAGGVSAEFLVDTGAGLVTIDRDLFRQLRSAGAVRELRRVAARLANGRVQALTVYEVARFRIGGRCDVGPVEVAVMDGAGRNLLGLSALTRAAPFAFHTSPPALALSGCGDGPSVAGLD